MVDAVMENPRTAPLAEREKALLAFVEKVNGASHALCGEDVQAVLAAGWTEEAIYDAVTVCALFNFFNKWCDGCGVHPMSAKDHAMSGERLARFGYV